MVHDISYITLPSIPATVGSFFALFVSKTPLAYAAARFGLFLVALISQSLETSESFAG